LDVKESGFRILEYLSRRPDITRKLETFVWNLSIGHDPEEYSRYGGEDRLVLFLYPGEERQVVHLLTNAGGDKNNAIPPMQFSDRLKHLHWEILWGKRDGRLGGRLGLLPAKLSLET
jgi:hypothetical protein